MANCNKLFLELEKEISLTPAQKKKLADSRTALQTTTTAAIKENKNLSLFGYYGQGSQSPTFNTGVLRSKDKTYDADIGIYLKEKPEGITCTTVMANILDAVAKHTDGGASHYKMCIRVVYAGDFDIDLPIYYIDKDGTTYIAVKNGDWRKDDPKGTAEWFRKKRKGTEGQLVKVIKFLKAWADKDLRGFKMPSGFTFTVWTATNFVVFQDRLDKALLNTLKSIKALTANGVSCSAPCAPFDDLTADLDKDQKNKFIAALDAFIADAEKAISSKNQLEASKLWQKHLGKRFKDGADEDVDAKEAALRTLLAPVKTQTAKLDQKGNIQESVGVPHQIHRNYGS